MKVRLHSHAHDRLKERGATEKELIETIQKGQQFSAKFNRTGFRKNFPYRKAWRGKTYTTKQIEAYAIKENESWLIITFITRYF